MSDSVRPVLPITNHHAGPRPRRSRGLSPARTAIYLVLIGLALFSLGPMLIFAFNSLKTQPELASNPLGIPGDPQWHNYVQAWQQANMAAGLWNSVIIVLGTVLGVCLISGLAAYAMARLDLPHHGSVILYLLITTSLPLQLFLVPLFYLWTNLHLYDTRLGLIIIYWAVFTPFSTLLLRSFLVTFPREYEQAARLDGAGEIRILRSVMLPLAWPGLTTIALVSGLSAYNEFLLAVTFIQDETRMPVATAFFSFQQGYTQDYTLISAAGMIMVLPMLIAFVMLQRRFIEGYASSGMTG